MSPKTTARMAVGLACGLLAASGLTGCGGSQPTRPAGPATTAIAGTPAMGRPTASTPAAGTPNTGSQRPVPVDAKRCPVTLPSDVGPPGVSPHDLFGWGSSHGNGKLWVGGLWPRGIIDAGPELVAKDGSVEVKFGWWRAATGTLHITGRRLDASAPPARASVPDGYGPTGFQASGVDFPTEGCWEITGALPTTSLTFITLVTKKRA